MDYIKKKVNKDGKDGPIGTLFLQVMEINFTDNIDPNFRPLLNLTFGMEQVESQPNRDAKNPRFKQNFSFKNVMSLEDSLKIKVFNGSSQKKSALMAHLKADIRHLAHEKQLTESFEFDPKSDYLGTLIISWRFESCIPPPELPYDERPVVGNIIIAILSAKGLKPRPGGGNRNPRVSITYDSNPKLETSIVDNTLNPVWPAKNKYIVKVRELKTLLIRMVDWDDFKRYHLGTVSLQVASLIKNSEAVEKTFPLSFEAEDSPLENHVGGQLTISVQYNHANEYKPKVLPTNTPIAVHEGANPNRLSQMYEQPIRPTTQRTPVTSFTSGHKSPATLQQQGVGSRSGLHLNGSPINADTFGEQLRDNNQHQHSPALSHNSNRGTPPQQPQFSPQQQQQQFSPQQQQGFQSHSPQRDALDQSPRQQSFDEHQDEFGNHGGFGERNSGGFGQNTFGNQGFGGNQGGFGGNQGGFSERNSGGFGQNTFGNQGFGGNQGGLGGNQGFHDMGAKRGSTIQNKSETTGPFSLSTALRDPETFHDVLYKVIVIGNSSVGKTNLLSRWCDNQFRDTMPTIGFEFKTKSFEVDGKVIKIQLWDTAGQEKFRAVTQTYYRNSNGAILVYDITCAESFLGLENWLEILQSAPGNEKIKIMLVGNKSDLESERQVPTESGYKWAQERGLFFLETSARENVNVQKAFQQLLIEIYKEASRPGANLPAQQSQTSNWTNSAQSFMSGGLTVISEGGSSGDGKCCMDSIFDDEWD